MPSSKNVEKSAIPIKSDAEIENIATVSASGNQEVGKMIAEAMEKVGKSGVITIEEAKGTETTSRWSKGCNSTAATSAPTSAPIPTNDGRNETIPHPDRRQEDHHRP